MMRMRQFFIRGFIINPSHVIPQTNSQQQTAESLLSLCENMSLSTSPLLSLTLSL